MSNSKIYESADYKDSLFKLDNWIINHGVSGWDIYDGLNSRLTQKLKNDILKIGFIQFNKYSPINFRNCLKIERGVDLKGLAIISYAKILLYNITQNKLYLNQYYEINDYLFQKSLISKVGYHSWSSHYFPYTTLGGSNIYNEIADIIITSRMLIQIVGGYKSVKSPYFMENSINISKFLIEKLYVINDDGGYFKYYDNRNNDVIVYNASAHALEALSELLSIYPSQEILTILQSTADYLLNNQKDDGSWNYSYDPITKKIDRQLDFHQGYMLDGLLAFLPYAHNKEAIYNAIIDGAGFYKNKLFRKDGRSFFRYPISYPIDIHNQAQGIITFSKLGAINNEYAQFAKTILDWTIENMQDPTGYYYYQKWPFITNKIPYMRWSEAWMMVALSTYISLHCR